MEYEFEYEYNEDDEEHDWEEMFIAYAGSINGIDERIRSNDGEDEGSQAIINATNSEEEKGNFERTLLYDGRNNIKNVSKVKRL